MRQLWVYFKLNINFPFKLILIRLISSIYKLGKLFLAMMIRRMLYFLSSNHDLKKIFSPFLSPSFQLKWVLFFTLSSLWPSTLTAPPSSRKTEILPAHHGKTWCLLNELSCVFSLGWYLHALYLSDVPF